MIIIIHAKLHMWMHLYMYCVNLNLSNNIHLISNSNISITFFLHLNSTWILPIGNCLARLAEESTKSYHWSNDNCKQHQKRNNASHNVTGFLSIFFFSTLYEKINSHQYQHYNNDYNKCYKCNNKSFKKGFISAICCFFALLQ